MNKTMKIFLVLSLICTLLFAGCKEQQGQESVYTEYTVNLNQKTAYMAVYDQLELTATVVDQQNQPVESEITWSSSNPEIAEVSEGLVFAKGEGRAEITATLATGETATCKITTEHTGMIPSLVATNITEGSLTIAKGQTYHIESQVTFGGVDYTDEDTVFTYRVADNTIAAVSEDGVITANAVGSTQITVIASWRGMGGAAMDGGADAYGLAMVIDLTVLDS